MNTIKILFIFLAALKSSTANCPTDKSPLVNPTAILAKNFNKTCNHLKGYEEFLYLILNVKIIFVRLPFVDVAKISIGPEPCLNEKVVDLFEIATDKAYPNSTMSNTLMKQYFRNIIYDVGLKETFFYAYGSPIGLNKQLTAAMKNACAANSGSREECKILIPHVTCFEDSLAPQNVLTNVLVQLGKSDLECFTSPESTTNSPSLSTTHQPINPQTKPVAEHPTTTDKPINPQTPQTDPNVVPKTTYKPIKSNTVQLNPTAECSIKQGDGVLGVVVKQVVCLLQTILG